MRPPALLPRRLPSLAILVSFVLLGAMGCAPFRSAAAPVPPAPVAAVQAPGAASIGLAAPAVQQADLPAGRILYVRDGNLWLWQGGNSRQFSEGGTWFQPSFSPNGKEIAYVYWTFNFSDVFVMSSDGSSSRRLTRGQASTLPDNSWAFRPAWSPDGERLAYVSDASSWFPQIWLMGKDGGNRRQVNLSTFEQDSWVDMLAWDPNGARLLFAGAPTMRDPSQLYLVDVAKGPPEKLTTHPNGAFDPAWSPDGSAIAYIGRTGAQGDLWVRNLDGTATAHTDKLSYVRSPTWSPDGKSLAVLAPKDGAFEIWIIPIRSTANSFELGEPRQLTRDGAVDPMSGLTWAP